LGIVAVVWDPGWDEPPPPGGSSRDSPSTSASASASASADSDRDDGVSWLAESESPRPGRWYNPTTRRGKLTLVLVVTVILVVTLVACCIGVAGLAKLRSVDATGIL
jgi:hypothetical protein